MRKFLRLTFKQIEATFAHFLKKIDFADSDSSKKKTNEIHLINKNNINIVNQKSNL